MSADAVFLACRHPNFCRAIAAIQDGAPRHDVQPLGPGHATPAHANAVKHQPAHAAAHHRRADQRAPPQRHRRDHAAGGAARPLRLAFRGAGGQSFRQCRRPPGLAARSARRIVPWYGPVFWPYAYSDIFDYAFWPDGYDDGYWDYAYDDFVDGLFWGEYGPPGLCLCGPAGRPARELCRRAGIVQAARHRHHRLAVRGDPAQGRLERRAEAVAR